MRLGLTTAPDRIRALSAEVERFGLDPVALPCIRIKPIPGGRRRLATASHGADVLVVTSARVVALAPAHLQGLPIIAVGAATAEAVAGAGGRVVWAGSSGLQQLVIEAKRLLAGKRIVVVGASNSAKANADELGRVAGSVVSIPLYTTVAISPAGDLVDGVVFGSPTAVAGWLTSRELTGVLIGAIGPTTASALRERGFEPDVVPQRPGFVNTIERMAAMRPERSAP